MKRREIVAVKNVWLYLVLAAFVYLGFCSYSLHQITVGDEILLLSGAESVLEGSVPADLDGRAIFAVEHPPLYVYAIAFVERLLGQSDVSARLVGVFCFLVSLFLIYQISLELFPQVVWIAVFLFAINPLAVQGSLLIDYDTAILPVVSLWLILYFLKAAPILRPKNIMVLGLLFALAVWAKDTTPLAFIVSIGLFYFLRQEYKKGLYYAATILLFGCGCFIVSRWLYCHLLQVRFCLPFISLKGRFIAVYLDQGLLYSLLMLARTVWKIMLWVSPFFLGLVIIAISKRVRLFRQQQTVQKADFLIIYTLLIFLGYLIVGQLGYSFPKFHYPVISTLCIIVSGLLFSVKADLTKILKRVLLFSLPALIFYNVYLVQDLIYSTDYLLKQALVSANQNITILLLSGLARSLLYFLPVPVYLFVLKRLIPAVRPISRLIIGLLVMSVAANLSLNILQAKAPYLTRYYYGTAKTKEVIGFIDENVAADSLIIAPVEIIYHSRNNSRPYYLYLRETLEKGDQEFAQAISNKDIDCLVLSLTAQSLRHFTRVINQPAVQQVLKDNFNSTKIGSYTVWLRKER